MEFEFKEAYCGVHLYEVCEGCMIDESFMSDFVRICHSLSTLQAFELYDAFVYKLILLLTYYLMIFFPS